MRPLGEPTLIPALELKGAAAPFLSKQESTILRRVLLVGGETAWQVPFLYQFFGTDTVIAF